MRLSVKKYWDMVMDKWKFIVITYKWNVLNYKGVWQINIISL